MYEISSKAKLPSRFYRISILNPEDLSNTLSITVKSNIPVDTFNSVVKSVCTHNYPLSITVLNAYNAEVWPLSEALNIIAGIRFYKIETTEETMVVHKTTRVYI